jgi:hypothetical protein
MTTDAVTTSAWRARLTEWVEHPRVKQAITALICLNAVTLGLETWDDAMRVAGGFLVALDTAILSVFVAEVSAKIVAYGRRFPRDPWNVFDFCVVAIGLIPATHSFSVLRALRVLRVLRLVSMVPSMRRVVQALLSAIPGMGSIVLLLGLIYYVSGVMATKLFGDSFPEWFGSIGASMYSLFQIMTLDGDRPAGDGGPRLGLGVLRAVHPAHQLRRPEPVHRHHRERDGSPPPRRGGRRGSPAGSRAPAAPGAPGRGTPRPARRAAGVAPSGRKAGVNARLPVRVRPDQPSS